MTYFVALGFLAILASLGTALFFMTRGGSGEDQQDASSAQPKTSSQKMMRALAMRVGLSIVLFVCILLAWKLGYIHPTGIAPGQ